MTSLTYDFKEKLKNLNVFEKIIAINVSVFFLGWLLKVIRGVPRKMTLTWLELPREASDFIVKPWSIITYGFTHYDIFHLLFNMVVLYFISRTMVNLFPRKQSLNIYFLGIIIGGLAYLAAYNLLPKHILLANAGPLVGASAGVRALLIFICAYMPYREAQFFAIKIKLWYIGVALVAFDLIGLFGINQGGNIAHLGGNLLGYIYATQLLKGKDIGRGFEKVMDKLANLFKPKTTLRTVHRSKKKPFAGHNKAEFNEFNNQKKIDLILDKINKSGYESLTKEEKAFLFKAGKD